MAHMQEECSRLREVLCKGPEVAFVQGWLVEATAKGPMYGEQSRGRGIKVKSG